MTPDMHVYHYGNYELIKMRQMANRHGTRLTELEGLIAAGVFVDLYEVTKDALRHSKNSLSLKAVEHLFGFPP